MAMESKFIWMNGKMVPFEKATIHFLTPALHYGAAVFEGIRAYNTAKGPAVFRLREHTERLLDSAHVFGFRELPWTVDEVCEAIKQTVKANDFKDCYIRPLLYLDGGGWNLNMWITANPRWRSPFGNGQIISAKRRWQRASAPISPPSRAIIRT